MTQTFAEFEQQCRDSGEWFERLIEECCSIAVKTYKLKPCPWCGESEQLIVAASHVQGFMAVGCRTCHRIVEATDAIDAWNSLPRRDNDE